MTNPILMLLFLFFVAVGNLKAQSTAFTYQGKLTDGGNPAAGQYDFEFRLFNELDEELGTVNTRDDLFVTGGIFTVTLDFGRNPFTAGGDRYLQIRVRPGASTGSYTTLDPKQPIVNTPYAIKSGTSDVANSAANADALGSIAAENYVQTNDLRMTDAREPTAGSANYIQNGSSEQVASDFNISGNGIAGGTLTGNAVNATSHFRLGGVPILSGPFGINLFVGRSVAPGSFGGNNAMFGDGAGFSNQVGNNNSFFGQGVVGSLQGTGFFNTSGSFNSFFGHRTGEKNTTGSINSFFGTGAGYSNTSGGSNSFFGHDAGNTNADGSFNTAIGKDSDVGVSNLKFATAIGANAVVMSDDTVVLGKASGTYDGVIRPADTVQVPGNLSVGGSLTSPVFNATQHFAINGNRVLRVGNDLGFSTFVGEGSGPANPSGQHNTFVGKNSGQVVTSGSENSIFGSAAGFKLTGNGNTLIGRLAGENLVAGDENVFIGSYAGRNFHGGSGNILIGARSGNLCAAVPPQEPYFGDNNIIIGTGFALCGNYQNTISIGGPVFGSNQVGIGNSLQTVTIFGSLRVQTIPTGGSTAVCLNGALLSTCSSSRRFKDNIDQFLLGLKVIKKLRPVSFDWKSSGVRDVGLVAEEVAAAEPLLATYTQDGSIDGVKYDRVAVIAINAIKELQDQVDELRKTVRKLQAAAVRKPVRRISRRARK